jgi:hypothetical protein
MQMLERLAKRMVVVSGGASCADKYDGLIAAVATPDTSVVKKRRRSFANAIDHPPPRHPSVTFSRPKPSIPFKFSAPV